MPEAAFEAVWKGDGKAVPSRMVFDDEGARAVPAAALKKDPAARGTLVPWAEIRSVSKTSRFTDGSIYLELPGRRAEIFFDTSEAADAHFAALGAAFGTKVPFVDVPEPPLKQLLVPVGWGLFLIAVGVGLFLYFRHLEEVGGSIRIQWMIALLYNILGAWGVLIVLGGLGLAGIGVGIARYRKATA
jgi:hypothetical protein